ncbi:hypothetical protein BJX70DRAFT_375432 [Aspergillus crustosus]
MEMKDEAPECDQNIPTDEIPTPTTTLAEPLTSRKLLEHADHSNLDENLQIAAQDSGYNSSGSSGHRSPPETPSGDMEEDIEQIHKRSRASSRTSISSIPASILTNLPDGLKPMSFRDGQDYMFQSWDHHGGRPVHTIRQREAMFRKPSSVRAMQMHTEDEGDDEFLTPPKRRGSQRISDISVRSAGSSPFKRSPFYSPTGAAGKPKIKEYPLVLLHCTLLPPSLPVPGLVGHVHRQKILREVLPTVYWKRWKLLEEKNGSGVLRDRGVLISHPEDMYDLLEERLLESLELQHPRLDHGHFLGRDETESEKDDRLAREGSSIEDEGEECPDCGGRVVRPDATRKWEINVFAANGLMRSGAWAAAWKEMEKVDVEVGLWLPPDVRAELERRLAEESPSHLDNGLSLSLLQGQENLLVGAPVRAPTPSPQTTEPPLHVTQERARSSSSASRVRTQAGKEWDTGASKASEEIDLHTLLVNYIRVLASDRRNVAIVFLTILVMFVAINSRSVQPSIDMQPFLRDIAEYTTSSVVPLQEHATQTWMENTSSQTVAVASPEIVPTVASTLIPEFSSNQDDVSDTLAEPSPAELEDVSPTIAAPSVEATHVINREDEVPTNAGKIQATGILTNTAELGPADSIDDSSKKVDEVKEADEVASMDVLPSSSTPLADSEDDNALFEQGEPDEPDELDEQAQPHEQSEPTILNARNDEIDKIEQFETNDV